MKEEMIGENNSLAAGGGGFLYLQDSPSWTFLHQVGPTEEF